MPVGWLIEVLKLSVEELMSKEAPNETGEGPGPHTCSSISASSHSLGTTSAFTLWTILARPEGL
jgi:hypothetical protein